MRMAIHPEGRLVGPNDLHYVQGIQRRRERTALVFGDADNDDERIVVVGVGLEEAATKQEGGDEEEDQNREPTAPWPGSCFLLYLFYVNAWLTRIVV
jgi:hypothetical protein